MFWVFLSCLVMFFPALLLVAVLSEHLANKAKLRAGQHNLKVAQLELRIAEMSEEAD